MKKLMIAAAAAAMVGGAFADMIVYDVKISGKKSVTANGVVQMYGEYDTGKVDKQGNAILKTGWFKGDFDLDGKADKICYRKSGSFSWAGVIAGCDCDYDGNGTVVGGMPAFKVAPIIAAVWDTKAKKEVKIDGTQAFANLVRSGAKTDFVEGAIFLDVLDAEGNWAGYLDLMGNGSYDVVKGYIKSVNGNFVGQLPLDPITYDISVECTPCNPGQNGAQICVPYDVALCYDYDIDTDVMSADQGTVGGVAFGTWSLKYNASKANKMKKLAPVKEADGKYYFMGPAIEKALGFPKYVKTLAKFEADVQ